MERRAFIAAVGAGLLAAPLPTGAQQAKEVPRIGYLLPNASRPTNEAFWAGLRDLGYVEAQNVTIERRYADGNSQRYPTLAAELVRLRVNMIVADGAEATSAAQQATATIPIVMIAADPVELGLIKSLNRPGGNITGLSTNAPNLMGKRLGLLKEALSNVSRVTVLANTENPAGAFFLREVEWIGRSVGLEVRAVPLHPGSDVDATLKWISNAHSDAWLLIEDPTLMSRNAARIAQVALRRHVPTMGGSRPYAETGILMTYGPSYPAMYRRTAFYVDKILKGVRPADLPVEEPTKFDLIINLKTVKALGLTIPPSLLARADEVIE